MPTKEQTQSFNTVACERMGNQSDDNKGYFRTLFEKDSDHGSARRKSTHPQVQLECFQRTTHKKRLPVGKE